MSLARTLLLLAFLHLLLLLAFIGTSPAGERPEDRGKEPPWAPSLPAVLLEGPADIYRRPGSSRTTIKLRDGTIIDGYRAPGSRRSSWTWPGGRRLDCYDLGTRIDCK